MTREQLRKKFLNASEAFLQANASDAGDTEPAKRTSENPTFETAPSTDVANLNKTEARFLEYLKTNDLGWIGVQNVTLKLADDCRYTPDFVIVNACPVAYEVKGFFRDDAKVKIKVAARLFPWIQFMVVRWERGGWTFTHVKP